MPEVKPKDMIIFLLANGYVEVSSNGSHRKLYNAQTNKTTIVPYHNKPLKLGTFRSILKQTGLKWKK